MACQSFFAKVRKEGIFVLIFQATETCSRCRCLRYMHPRRVSRLSSAGLLFLTGPLLLSTMADGHLSSLFDIDPSHLGALQGTPGPALDPTDSLALQRLAAGTRHIALEALLGHYQLFTRETQVASLNELAPYAYLWPAVLPGLAEPAPLWADPALLQEGAKLPAGPAARPLPVVMAVLDRKRSADRAGWMTPGGCAGSPPSRLKSRPRSLS